MGDILQVLVIIGIIIFAVVKKLAGSSEEREQRPPVVPTGYNEEWEEVKTVKKNTTPFLSYDYDYSTPSVGITEKQPSGKQTPKSEQSSPSPIQEEPNDEVKEFDIHSAEEVRRAIIWSEILNRKY